MTIEPHRPVAGALLRLHWTDNHGVRGNASHEINTVLRDARRPPGTPGFRPFGNDVRRPRGGCQPRPRAGSARRGRHRTSRRRDRLRRRPRPAHRPGEADLAAASDASWRRAVQRDPVAGPRTARRAGSSLPIEGFRP